MILFSPSCCAFFDTDFHEAIPADALEIGADLHAELLDAQSSGAVIVAGPHGQPIAISRAASRNDLLAAINAWRSDQEQQAIVFEHAGRQWDGGLAVRDRLQAVARMTKLPDGFFWTDAANNDVPVSIADVAALNQAHESALVMQGWRIHARQREMKRQLSSLADSDLGAFVVGW